MDDRVSTLEHIKEILREQNIRRDQQFADQATALELQTKEVARRLEAYPTLRDFNDLKSRVDTIIALAKVMSTVSLIFGVWIAFLTYVKP